MELKDLFVSYKQVDPVEHEFIKPELPQMMYINIDRAQKVAQRDQKVAGRDWKVGGSESTTHNWVVKTKRDGKRNTPTPVVSETPTKPENSKPSDTRSSVGRRESALLQSYRNNKDYELFKKELDVFIDNNPQYRNIKDNLDYLAALESRYRIGVENYAGSTALGWFQFMDSTRHTYNQQSRKEFANDPQAQLKAAAQHYTDLQKQIQKWGGDPNDFVTMYSAWWRPESARQYILDNTYDYSTQYNESLSGIRKRASDLFV